MLDSMAAMGCHCRRNKSIWRIHRYTSVGCHNACTVRLLLGRGWSWWGATWLYGLSARLVYVSRLLSVGGDDWCRIWIDLFFSFRGAAAKAAEWCWRGGPGRICLFALMPVPCLIYEQLDVCCVGEAENWKRKTDCRGTDLWAHHKTINKTETRAT